MRLLKKRLGCCTMSLFASRHRECLRKILKNVYTPLDLFQTILRPKGCVKNLLKKTHISQLGDFPDCFKTKRMCERAVEDEPNTLEYVPDHPKTEEMRKEAVCREPFTLIHVPDHLKTQGAFEKAVEEDPWQLAYFHDHFKTKRMCERALEDEPETLKHVPDHQKR